ncbi:cytotoxic T cell differentiation [Pristimantis euphronides]
MVSHTMLPVTSLPILLSVFLCTHQLKLTSNPLLRGSSNPIILNCETEYGEASDVGVFWFRHLKGTVSPESMVYYSVMGRPTYKDPKSGSIRFLANVSGSKFSLEIKKFDENDQGTYFCLINKNSVLYISPGLQLVYPEVTTPKPKTTSAPPARTTEDSRDCGSAEKKPEPLGLSCNIYILAPLIGICCFFLICFLITLILLSCRTRRRICRCKPRPMGEKNGKPHMPNRHI